MLLFLFVLIFVATVYVAWYATSVYSQDYPSIKPGDLPWYLTYRALMFLLKLLKK